ncbi:MAG: hypothetical protein EOO74_07785, partial [Myxococcales bacterium]
MPVTADQLKDIDKKLVKTINATDGSVHTPASKIVIGGAGLELTSPLIGTDANFTESLSAGVVSCQDIYCDTITASSSVETSGNVACESLFCGQGATFGAIQTPTGGNANIGGNCTVDGDLEAGATSLASLSCSGPSQFGGPTTLVGTTTISSGGALNINGTSTIAKPMKHVGRGRQLVRVLTVTSPADGQTFTVDDYSIIRVPNGLMPDNRNFVLSNAGAEEGDVVRLVNHSLAYAVVFRDSGATVVAALSAGDGHTYWADVVFTGGGWERVASRLVDAHAATADGDTL